MSSNWPIARLEDLCSIDTGKSDTKDAIVDGAYPFFDRSRIVKRSNRYLFDAHALIIPGEGAEFLPKQFEGKFDLHQRAYALHGISDSLDIRFLYHYLHHVKDYFPKVAVGATVKSLRRRHFADLEIPVPPLDEQKRIVAKLDQALGHVDELSMATQSSLQEIDALWNSVLKESFNPNNSQNQGTPVSSDWIRTTLGEIALIQNGSTPLKSRKDFWESGSVPWFTIEDLRQQGFEIEHTQKAITKLALDETSVSLIPKDSILVCCTASVGAVAINRVPLTTNQQFNGLTITNPTKVDLKFLFYWFLTQEQHLQSLGRSTTISYVSMAKLKAIQLLLPPLDEQKRIVAKLDAIKSEIDELKNLKTATQSESLAIRSSILSAAFAGDL